MNLLEVEDGVLRLAFECGHAMDHIRLVLHDVRYENVLAQIVGQVGRLFDLNAEEDLLAEQLLRLLNQKIIIWLTITANVARPVRASKLTSNTAWDVGSSGEDGRCTLAIERVLQVLQLQVALSDEDGLGWIPEWIVLLVGEVRNRAT